MKRDETRRRKNNNKHSIQIPWRRIPQNNNQQPTNREPDLYIADIIQFANQIYSLVVVQIGVKVIQQTTFDA